MIDSYTNHTKKQQYQCSSMYCTIYMCAIPYQFPSGRRTGEQRAHYLPALATTRRTLRSVSLRVTDSLYNGITVHL